LPSPAEAVAVMTAMRDTIPILRGNGEWAREIEKLSAGRSERERRAIAKRTGRIGKRIHHEITKALRYRPYLR
jgi:hypothetical protein